MRDIIITLMVFGAIPFVLMRPWLGILLFAWISYMNPHRLTYGFAYNFQFALIAALVTMVGVALSQEKKQVPATPVTIMLLIFVLWTALTTVFAYAPEEANDQFIKFIKIQLMTVLTLMMINTRQRINWLVIFIVFSLGFYGVRGGIFSIMTGGNYRVWGPPGSFFEDNNQLALTLIMTLPMMHYLQLISANRWIRHGFSVMMLLTLGAIIGTYSRGALVALTMMGFALWLRSSRKLPVMFAATVCIVGVLSFMPQKWFDRMDTINSYEEDESASGRIDSWIFAINVANEHVLGGGFKVNTRSDIWPIFNPDAFKPRAPHSIYFEVLGEHGWIGLAMFLGIGVIAVFTCRSTEKLVRGRPDLKWAGDLSKMLSVSLVGYAAAGAFLNLATFDLYYHVLAIIVLTRVCAKRALAEPVPEDVRAQMAAADTPGGPAAPDGTAGEQPDAAAGRELGGASGYLIRRR